MKLKAENLVKRYGKRYVVNNVSVEVEQGKIVGLLGHNGAGKTTTFYMTVGLVKPDSGKILLEGQDFTAVPMFIRAWLGLGYLAHEASVFRNLSVEDNIRAVLEMMNISKQEQRERTESLLEEFNLTHVRKNMGKVLSGGERRRTEIARALATNPKFILLDEPFAGVDPLAVEEIQKIVYKLKFKNLGVLITDHNADETLSITDWVYVMSEGKVFREGVPEDLANDEEVRKKYLGELYEFKKKVFQI